MIPKEALLVPLLGSVMYFSQCLWTLMYLVKLDVCTHPFMGMFELLTV